MTAFLPSQLVTYRCMWLLNESTGIQAQIPNIMQLLLARSLTVCLLGSLWRGCKMHALLNLLGADCTQVCLCRL